MKTLHDLIQDITAGITIGDFRLYAKRVTTGKYLEAIHSLIFVEHGYYESPLLSITTYQGRLPHYRPWIEVYNINREIKLGDRFFTFIDSEFENRLLAFLSDGLGPGQSIFWEYSNDKETKSLLKTDSPPFLSRLGYKLLNLGFTWFKDWYFPEGWLEGGQKIQAEKPLNNEIRTRHLREICDQTNLLLDTMNSPAYDGSYLTKALRRAACLRAQYCQNPPVVNK